MRSFLRLSWLLVVAGCAQGAADSGSPGGGEGQRAIAEADIVQLDGGRLYAMSKSGTVSVVDVSAPGRLTLLGQTTLPGEPFEMYRRGELLVVMANGAQGTGDGVPRTDRGAGAVVTLLDLRDARLAPVAAFAVPGELADSRIVGDVLYLATYENSACFRCGPKPRTMVTSFDLATPADMRQVDQLSFESNAPDGYNLPWGSHWKRSIFVTDQRLYIGGHADIAPGELSRNASKEGIIDVIDVSDPAGRLRPGARLTVAGAILSRWQLEERNGILRVISQRGAGRTGNGIGAPEVDTFRVDGPQSFAPLGHMTMRLPRQEGLRAVRFDEARAYAITYNQTDPLFVIDLSDPRSPVQRGELFMPGFMFHLEPHGDRLIGLGVDRADPQGSLNVSLFDVSDARAPRMIKRVAFATPNVGEDYAILNGELAEDQDRIQKAFRVLGRGLVVVPFTALAPSTRSEGCANEGGGVQLVDWSGDTLTKSALLPLPGNPRRAFENAGELVAVSDSNVRSYSLGASAQQTADLVIGTCVPRANPYGGFVGGEGGFERYPACSAAPGRTAAWPLIFLALFAGAILRLWRRA
jgi:hypothetical protein